MEIDLRPAAPEDVDLLFRWTNDPTVRANAFSTDPIPYENHVAWFRGRLENPDCWIYIGMKQEKPVGVIRVERIQDAPQAGLISYSVDRDARGQGIGTELLQQICRQDLEMDGIRVLAGQVKLENVPSQRAFEKAGYQEFLRNDRYVEYREKRENTK